MKLFCFSPKEEGEVAILAWINIRRYANRSFFKGFIFALVFPVPIKQEYYSFETGCTYIGWRCPLFGFSSRITRNGKRVNRVVFYMYEIKRTGLKPTPEMIKDRLDDGLTPEQRLLKFKL